MGEFAKETWGMVVQLSIALSVLAGIATSIYILVTKTGLCTTFLTKRQIRRRLKTCPQNAALEAYKAAQEHKLDSLHKELQTTSLCNLMLQGSHIVLFCMFAQFRGFLTRYEREWLHMSMKDYENKGGNHGVKDIFDETLSRLDTLTEERD